MDLDTALLRAFLITAEELHFGRAAARLFISQQALSKRIARLEAVLGARLFERDQRRVALTAAGLRLLPSARDAVAAVDAVAATAGVGDPLLVDVMDLNSAAAGLVRAALDRDPPLRLETSARLDGRSGLEAVRAGEADIVLGRASAVPWPPDIRRRCALIEPLGLLVGEGHPLAARPAVTARELTSVELRFPMAGAPLDWVSFLDEFIAGLELDVDRDGCSINFQHFVEYPAEHPDAAGLYGLRMSPPHDARLRVIPIVEPTPVFVWAAMWRRRIPTAAVDRIVPEEVRAVPEGAWLPQAEREWLRRS